MQEYFEEIIENSRITHDQLQLITTNPFERMDEETWNEYRQRELFFSEEPYYESEKWDRIKDFERFAVASGFRVLYKGTFNNSQLPHVGDERKHGWIQKTFYCLHLPRKEFYLYITFKTSETYGFSVDINLHFNSRLKVADGGIFGIPEWESDGYTISSLLPLTDWKVHYHGRDDFERHGKSIDVYSLRMNDEYSFIADFGSEFFKELKIIASHAFTGFLKVEIPKFNYRENVFQEILQWILTIEFFQKFGKEISFLDPEISIRYGFPIELLSNEFSGSNNSGKISANRGRDAITIIDNKIIITSFAGKIIEYFMDYLITLRVTH